MNDTHDDGGIVRDGMAPPSRRRFLGQLGAAGLAGMAVPLLGKTAASASISRSGQPLLPPLNPWAGATVFPSGTQTQLSALQKWSGLVYPVGIGKIYFPPQVYPTTDATVTAYTKAGAQVVLCYKPRHGVGTDKMNEDLDSMVTSIKALKQSGATVAAVTIWNEPDNSKNNVSPGDYQALYVNDYAGLHAHAPVICCFAGDTPENAGSYFLAGFSDGVTVDYYGHNYLSKKFLSSWTTIAKDANVGFGVLESGDTSAGQAALDQADFARYLTSVGQPPDFPGDPVNSIQAVLDDWLSHGRPFLGYAWWQDNSNPGGPNMIDSSGDFRIPYLQLLQESL